MGREEGRTHVSETVLSHCTQYAIILNAILEGVEGQIDNTVAHPAVKLLPVLKESLQKDKVSECILLQ